MTTQRKGIRPVKIEPSLSVTPLSQVTPGSVVQIDGKLAISAITARQQADKVLATYDQAESIFQYSPVGDPILIAFTGDHILRPDLGSGFEADPAATSRNEVYFEGDTPHVVLQVSS